MAAETAASLHNLSPTERRSATVLIEALNGATSSFPTGDIPPRPTPDGPAAIMRGGCPATARGGQYSRQ